MRIILLAFASFVLILVPAQAGTKQSKIVYDAWDVSYLEGNRAGYSHTFVEEYTEEGKKLYRATTELRLNVKRSGTIVKLAMDTGNIETSDGTVVGIFTRQFLGTKKTLDISGKIVDKKLRLVLDKTKQLAPVPWDGNVTSLYKQQTIFRDKKVEPGTTFVYRGFEPSINLVVTNAVKVQNYEKVELLGKMSDEKLLRVQITPEKIQTLQLPTLTVWLDAKGTPLRSETQVPGIGKMVQYRGTKQLALRPGALARTTDVILNQVIKLKRRLANPYKIRRAVYQIETKGLDNPTSAFMSSPIQTIKNAKGNTFEMHVDAAAPFVTKERQKSVDKKYLSSSYFINCKDARVKQFAKKAVGGARDSWLKATRIEKWVKSRMRPNNAEAMAPADHVAKTLTGDCSEFAMLMTAMCRAEQVPARTAIGLIYANIKGQPAFAFHMWTEVFVHGRWFPLDATLGQGYVGATHLKVTHHDWDDVRSLTPLLPVIQVVGKMKIQVLQTSTPK
ncbi:MAG: transglutaminase family protein [Gemmataceae bacterium]